MYYEVMMNPEVEQNIWQEVDKLGTPTYEMLTKDMRYSNAVFLEALRLYPPVPRNLKTARESDVLPNGTVINAGDRIMFSTYAIGRNRVSRRTTCLRDLLFLYLPLCCCTFEYLTDRPHFVTMLGRLGTTST